MEWSRNITQTAIARIKDCAILASMDLDISSSESDTDSDIGDYNIQKNSNVGVCLPLEPGGTTAVGTHLPLEKEAVGLWQYWDQFYHHVLPLLACSERALLQQSYEAFKVSIPHSDEVRDAAILILSPILRWKMQNPILVFQVFHLPKHSGFWQRRGNHWPGK